jgi:hypothetical protein
MKSQSSTRDRDRRRASRASRTAIDGDDVERLSRCFDSIRPTREVPREAGPRSSMREGDETARDDRRRRGTRRRARETDEDDGMDTEWDR